MISAALIRELISAGLSGEALVAACERIEAAQPASLTAKQRANRRYYEANQDRLRERALERKGLLKLSETDLKPTETTETADATAAVTGAADGLARADSITPTLQESLLPKTPPTEGQKGKVPYDRDRHRETGWRVVELLSELRSLPDSAAALHRAVADALEAAGLEVQIEFSTGAYGDDREGRIDIVADDEAGRVAIELDTRKPRRRSVQKLALLDAFRIIALRGVAGEAPAGIDAVVQLDVRLPTADEAADKTLRGSRIPDDWRPTPEDVAWAISEGLSRSEIGPVTDEFRDFWQSVPGVRGRKLKWSSTWRNRVREVVARQRLRGPPRGGGRGSWAQEAFELDTGLRREHGTGSDEALSGEIILPGRAVA